VRERFTFFLNFLCFDCLTVLSVSMRHFDQSCDVLSAACDFVPCLTDDAHTAHVQSIFVRKRGVKKEC
jgi:hypothetical protein